MKKLLLAAGTLVALLAACLPAMTAQTEPIPGARDDKAESGSARASGKLADFMMGLPEHRVLHGWGHGIFRWDSDAVPYFRELPTRPVIASSILKITDPTRGEPLRMRQFEKISDGWRASSGKRYHFIPLIGVQTHPADFRKRGQDLARAFLLELGLGQQIQRRGSRNLSYQLGVFEELAKRPAIWRQVHQNLARKGYDVAGLESLDGLLRPGSNDPRQDKLFTLWDDVLLRANESLKAKGYRFGDLEILEGSFDRDIQRMARAVASVDGPVLIRLMYETIGGVHRSSLYGPETFVQAWRHFVDLMRANGASNAEFVFHSAFGIPEVLERWYPGDDYVDWVAGSLFESAAQPRVWVAESGWAARHGKPYLLAESGPTGKEFNPDGIHARNVWSRWFEPYFDFLESNDDVKAFVYVSINRNSGPKSSFTAWGDTRVQSVPDVLQRYEQRLQKPVYLNSEEFWQLFDAWRKSSP